MQEIKLPKKIGSYLLIEKIYEVPWGNLYLSAKGNENEIREFLIVGLLEEWFSDNIISYMNNVGNQLRGISELFLWHPIEFYYESPFGVVVFPIFSSFALESILKRAQDNMIPLSIDLALLMYSRVLEALEILHEVRIDNNRLIHGLPTPSNIFISIEGEVKLLHSGIFQSCILNNEFCNEFREKIKEYLSPEQANNQISGNRATDIYTLAVGLLECLANKSIKEMEKKPFPELINDLSIYAPSAELMEAPKEIKDILMKALSENPSDRYKSCEDMRQQLDDFLFASEFQPSTFNLAFYMNGLYRDEAGYLNQLIEEAKKVDLTSYFVVPIIEEEKVEEFVIEKESPEEIIELEETGSKEAEDEKQPIFSPRDSVLFKTMEVKREEPLPAKKSSLLPIIIAVLIVIVGASTMFLLMRGGKIGSKTPQLTEQKSIQTDLTAKLDMEKKRREEIEKKYEQDTLALQEKIQELEEKLKELPTEKEKKEALEGIKKLQEMQKRQDELYTKEIASIESGKDNIAQDIGAKQDLFQVEKGAKGGEVLKDNSQGQTTPEIKKLPDKSQTGAKNIEAPSIREGEKQQKTEPIGVGSSESKSPNTVSPNKETPSLNSEIEEIKNTFAVPSVAYDSELDSPLKIIKDVKPEYPIVAKRQKVGGIVIVSLIINTDGKVEKATILKGHPLLNDAVLEAAKKLVYSIPKKNGVPVKAQISKVYNFKP